MQAIPKKERIYSSLKVRKDRHKEINPVLCQANFELILKIKKALHAAKIHIQFPLISKETMLNKYAFPKALRKPFR